MSTFLLSKIQGKVISGESECLKKFGEVIVLRDGFKIVWKNGLINKRYDSSCLAQSIFNKNINEKTITFIYEVLFPVS